MVSAMEANKSRRRIGEKRSGVISDVILNRVIREPILRRRHVIEIYRE